MKYRKHQVALQQIVQELKTSELPSRILAHVVPGGGKSLLPGLVKQAFPQFKIAWFVPRLNLAVQAAESMKQHFGYELRESGNDIDPSRGTDGFIATHQALSCDPDLWRRELNRWPYILVFDELHHAKLDRDGNHQAVASALRQLDYKIRLDMTGTLETSDNTLICGVEYELRNTGLYPLTESPAYRSIRYTRQDALADDAIVPIEFHYHDGPVSFLSGGAETTVNVAEADRDLEGDVLSTALRTDFADDLFNRGVLHWKRCRAGKLIVVTFDQSAARKYHKKLAEMGINASLAITDNPEAHPQVKSFRGVNGVETNALVTCMMAYEGLDAPAASHLVCLTHIRSAPWIEQMFGRVWRSHRGKQRCFAFVPADPRMARVIETIRKESPGCVCLPTDKEGGNGGGNSDVVALNGQVSNVEREVLDGDLHNTEAIAEKLDDLIFQNFGFGLDDPMFDDVLARRRLSGSLRVETVAERMNKKSGKLADECRAKASRNNLPFGYFEKRLWSINGKGFEDMTEEELDNAFKQLSRM